MRDFGPLVTLDQPAFIHDSVEIFGANRIGKGVSIWPRVVMRAERFENVIGAYSNLQDFVMVHICGDRGTTIGSYCSIAHKATIHGCIIGDNCLIGINATVMDNVVIGDNCIIAGHSIVTAGTVVPANSVVAGVPAKVIKENSDNFVGNRMNALIYHHNGSAYARGEHRAWDGATAQAEIAADRARTIAEYAGLKAEKAAES